MVWTAGSKLAVAVSEAGGLRLIGAGSMPAELLREHIRKARGKTKHPFGVNIPLAREDVANLVGAGQRSGLVREILPAAEIVRRLMEQYHDAKRSMP
ncbi:MAG: nitronate monooxygenase [Bacteroidetes bacterium]|nr:nitronate monooxygenase [Bacteroidota bacterium]